MRAIFEHQPHVEHLRDWKEFLDFCLGGIRIHLEAVDLSTSMISNGRSATDTQNASAARTAKSFTSQPGNRGIAHSSPCAEFIMCVRWLVQAPNAPLENERAAILSAMVDFLHSAQLVGRGHQDAFVAINLVLARIANDHGIIVRSTILELVPLIKELWSNRRSAMREEMLTTLIYSEAHIESLIGEPDKVSFRTVVENLIEVMMTEYSKRPEKDILQLNDLSFRLPCTDRGGSSPTQTQAFHLQSLRAESQWALVYLLASFSVTIDQSTQHDAEQDQDMDVEMEMDQNLPNKKAKRAPVFDDHLRRISLGLPSSRTCYLQLVSFMLTQESFDAKALSGVLERVSGFLGDSNQVISSWAMLCLTCCIYQPHAAASLLAESWTVIWRTVARSATVNSTCRSACLLLDTALVLGIVKYGDVASFADGMFASIDLNGPALLCDSSLRLWTTLVRLRLSDNPSSGKETIERVLRWLFNKWTPSMCIVL